MPQFDSRSCAPHKGYRRNGQPVPDATVLLEIDHRIWRLTPTEARRMADLLRAAALVGEDIGTANAKECAGDSQGDRVG